MAIPNLKLKAKIIEQFGSQAEFAEVVGLDDAIISKVVRARKHLSDEEKIRWARLLETEPVELWP